MIRFIVSLVLTASTLGVGAQTEYVAPLKGPLLVTGTFGELRTDHYHAGLDFRARVGTPVRAVAAGYVSRIKVAAGGYGQAIYVDHPDGYRSVYGHLETLAAPLLDTVRARQFAEETFALDLRLDSLAFPVEAGEVIGRVGNRGHSFGPHLHFEMREQAGDVAVNPLQFGFAVPDGRRPDIRNLRVYELDAQDHYLATTTLRPTRAGDGVYRVNDTVFVASGRLGIGVKTYDRQNGLPNQNGVYRITLAVDSTPVYAQTMDRIPFELTQYLNARTDYADWIDNTSWYYRMWMAPLGQAGTGARPPVPGGGGEPRPYAEQWFTGLGSTRNRPPPGSGTVEIAPGQSKTVGILVEDYAGNRSELTAIIHHRPSSARTAPATAPDSQPVRTALPAGERLIYPTARPHQYFLPAGEPSRIETGVLRLDFPADALYRAQYFRYAKLRDNSAGVYSSVHALHEDSEPLHGAATLALRPFPPVPDSLRGKIYLGKCAADGAAVSLGGEWIDGYWFEGRINTFGQYALYLDTVPPVVEIRSFPTDLRRKSGFSLIARDAAGNRGLRYRGEIDGRWVLLERDAKYDRLNFRFADHDLPPGEHLFTLTVTDGRGNSTFFRRRFRR